MTDRRNEGEDLSRCRDAGVAEALPRLGPEAAAAHHGGADALRGVTGSPRLRRRDGPGGLQGGARWSLEDANDIMALKCRSPDSRMTDLTGGAQPERDRSGHPRHPGLQD